VALVTVRSVLAETPEAGWIAVIVVVPALSVVARPLLLAALLIVAMLVAELDQVTAVVRSCTERSVYVPVAVNCCAMPSATLGLEGVISIETSVADPTVKFVVAEMPVPGWVAVIVALPTLSEEALPLVPTALLIAATLFADEDQVTDVVRSCTELSV
jgi:hypothetical protein